MAFIAINIAVIEAFGIKIEDSKSENQGHSLTLFISNLLRFVIASPYLFLIWSIMGTYFAASAIIFLSGAVILALFDAICWILRLFLMALATILHTIGTLLIVFDNNDYFDDYIPWLIS